MAALPFRADLDDRDLTVGRKIREAEREWIPFVAVVGEKEVQDNVLSVRLRDGSQVNMPPAALRAELERLTAGKPFRPLNVPSHLTRRPVFVG